MFRVCLQVMCMSENKILTQCFDREELSDKKRPDTVRYLVVCVCVCVFPVCVLSFSLPAFHSLICHTLMHPSILSHSTTNSGVFPLCSVEWVVSWGFSAASHSLRNAPTLVCPSHKHTKHTHLNRELSQAGELESQSFTLGPVLVSSGLPVTSALIAPLRSSSPLQAVIRTHHSSPFRFLPSITAGFLSHPLTFVSPRLPNQPPAVFCLFVSAPPGGHPVQSQSGETHGDPDVEGAVVRPLHQAQ